MRISYGQLKKRNMWILGGLGLLLVITAAISLRVGSYETSTFELIRGLFGLSEDPKINAVAASRLPRICTAAVCGAGLGVTGCILQAILKNPLASSSTLGISQGAGFGAAFAIMVLGAGSGLLGMTAVSLFAFLFSLLSSLIVLALSRFRGAGPETMILAGVALSFMFTGATALLQYFADDVELSTFVFWTFGNLGTTGWGAIRLLALVVVLALLFFILRRWDYNALYAGEETAVSLGLSLGKTRVINLLICSFVAALIASQIGIINFIGLVAPHMVRRLVGENYCFLVPASAIMGGILLLAGDLVARLILSPVVLPIGAVTSLLGAPLFLYLLFKGKKAYVG